MKFGVLLSMLLLLSGYFKEPEFVDARHFRISALGLKKSRVNADLYYFNPNNLGLQMKKAELDIYIDNRFLGHSVIDTLILIPRRDTFSLPVNLEVEMKNLFPNAFALLTRNEIELRIEGTARIGKAGLFLNVPVKYRGKQKLM